MKKLVITALVIISNICILQAQLQQIFTIGPTIHVNFDKPKLNVSYGIEGAYWNWYGFPYSFDTGIEYGGKKMRIYSEVQTGIGVTGISIGPVIQYNFVESKLNLGYQGSIWVGYFLGFDARIRYIEGKKIYCYGSYIKIPFGYGLYHDLDGDGNPTTLHFIGTYDPDESYDDWD